MRHSSSVEIIENFAKLLRNLNTTLTYSGNWQQYLGTQQYLQTTKQQEEDWKSPTETFLQWIAMAILAVD
jgi:hypothetical protein